MLKQRDQGRSKPPFPPRNRPELAVAGVQTPKGPTQWALSLYDGGGGGCHFGSAEGGVLGPAETYEALKGVRESEGGSRI